MKTFDELHKEHPTPWRISRTLDGAVRFVADANGNPVTMETVVAMMNAAASRDGYTPECVAACIKAVEAGRTYHEHSKSNQHVEGWMDAELDARCAAYEAMDHAISLLPKGQPDA